MHFYVWLIIDHYHIRKHRTNTNTPGRATSRSAVLVEVADQMWRHKLPPYGELAVKHVPTVAALRQWRGKNRHFMRNGNKRFDRLDKPSNRCFVMGNLPSKVANVV